MTLRAILVAVALVLALAVPTAAVTGSEDDAGAVTLTPHDGHNGQYASVEEGKLEVSFEQLNDDAVTTAHRVFTITADADDADCPVRVWVEVDGAVVYRGDDPSDRLDGEDEAAVLEPGESVAVGLQLDTTGSVPDPDAMTVHADEATACTDGNGDPRQSGPGDEKGTSNPAPSSTPTATPTPTPAPDGTDGGPNFDVDVSVAETGEPGERNVTVTVRNTGDAEGLYVANLSVGGTVVDSRTVAVPAGETRRVSFRHRFATDGSYDIQVGDWRETVSVEGPADADGELAVTTVTVGERELDAGDAATVTATVENTGDATGERTVALEFAGVVVDSATVTIPAGETRTVSFRRVLDTPGVYPVAVGGVDGGEVVVRAGDSTTSRLLASDLGATLMPSLLVGLLLAIWRRRLFVALWRRR